MEKRLSSVTQIGEEGLKGLLTCFASICIFPLIPCLFNKIFDCYLIQTASSPKTRSCVLSRFFIFTNFICLLSAPFKYLSFIGDCCLACVAVGHFHWSPRATKRTSSLWHSWHWQNTDREVHCLSVKIYFFQY